MSVIIASDIHGSINYTKKLCTLIEKEQPETIILLGDLLNNYHMSDVQSKHEVANLLNQYASRIIAVRGNCDRNEDLNLLIFDMTKHYLEYHFGNYTYGLTHGHLPFLNQSKRLISGHTHVYKISPQYLNPGSVGLPRQSQEHTCLLYKNNTFSLLDLDSYTIINKIKI